MSRKGPRRTQVEERARESRISRGSKALIAVILGIATLLGYVILIPRITATLSDPPDPNNPFSSSVTITNTGVIPLASVGSGIAIREIKVMGPNGVTGYVGSQDYKSVITTGEGHELGLDQSFSFALNNLSVLQGLNSDPMVSADLAVVVDYEIPIVHVHCSKRFIRFAQKQTNGNFYWYAKSN